LPCAHETQAALTFMQLAIARADVALDPVVFQDVPITPRFALDGLIHVAVILSFRDHFINGDRARAAQDASGSAKHDNPALSVAASSRTRSQSQLRSFAKPVRQSDCHRMVRNDAREGV